MQEQNGFAIAIALFRPMDPRPRRELNLVESNNITSTHGVQGTKTRSRSSILQTVRAVYEGLNKLAGVASVKMASLRSLAPRKLTKCTSPHFDTVGKSNVDTVMEPTASLVSKLLANAGGEIHAVLV